MFKTAKAFATAALGSFSAIFLGTTCFCYHSAQETRAALDSLSRERAALDSGIRRAKGRIMAANRDSAEFRSAPSTEPRRQAQPRQASEAAVNIMSLLNTQSILAMMEPDPKLFALALKNYRAIQARKYGPLFRALDFNPEQIEKFITLSAQHAEALVDIVSTAGQQGVPLDDPAVATLMKQENDQFTSAREALLGDAGERKLRQSNRLLPVSGVVNELATTIALTAAPLSGTQADQLTQILANASSKYQSGGAATQATIDWPAALGQAQGILSPTQFAFLQDQYLGGQISQLQTQFISQEMETR